MTVEEIVARFEQEGGIISLQEIDALIASWRERGEALAKMQDQQANALQQALYDALKDKP